MSYSDFENTPINQVPLAVLDTETTGLHPGLGDRVIEIGILRLEGGKETGQVNSLVNPGRPIPERASSINHIYDHDVADKPVFKQLAHEIETVLEGALIVAHNARFDAEFLSIEWSMTKRPALENQCVCTLDLARNCFHFHRNRLSDVASVLGVRIGRAHRAMNDVWITAQVFNAMMRELSQRGLATVGDIIHAQGGRIVVPPPNESFLPDPLGSAINSRSRIGIRYCDAEGTITERVVDPLYTARHYGEEYLIAYCHTRQSQRTFHLDRIMGAFPVED
ncbi:MAG: exonuclease domain-containing protein [Chloroflexota bacterium]